MKKRKSAAKRASGAGHPTYAYVGGFTPGSAHHDYAHAKGISVFRIDPKTGDWTLVQICEAATPNPGFLALTDNQKFLYACHGSASEMSAYAVDQQTGKLTPLNRQRN